MRSDPWGDVSSWALKGISTQKLGVKRTYHEAAFGIEDEGVVEDPFVHLVSLELGTQSTLGGGNNRRKFYACLCGW